MKVRDALTRLRKEGWVLDHTTGSHRQFTHPTKKGLVTVPGKPGDTPRAGDREQREEGSQVGNDRVHRRLRAPVRPGGNWSAYVPDLPGCVSTGDTLDECRAMIREAVELHIAGLRRHGYDVPRPPAASRP